MRFGSPFALKARHTDMRCVRKFLFAPRTFNSPHTRWLEWAWIVERVEASGCEGFVDSYVWREVGFADEPQHSWDRGAYLCLPHDAVVDPDVRVAVLPCGIIVDSTRFPRTLLTLECTGVVRDNGSVDLSTIESIRLVKH